MFINKFTRETGLQVKISTMLFSRFMAQIDKETCIATIVTSGSTTVNHFVDGIRDPYVTYGYDGDGYYVPFAFDIDGCRVIITPDGVRLGLQERAEIVDSEPKVGGKWPEKVGSSQILVVDQKDVLKRIT